VWWRYTLGLGAALSIVSDCGADNRLKRLSHRVADAADRKRLVEETIAFWVRGFGPAGKPEKTNPAADDGDIGRRVSEQAAIHKGPA
jgi:hypothetical protein